LEFYKKLLIELIKRYGLAKEKDFGQLRKERRVFATILTQSNAEIVSQHCLGVEIMQRIIEGLRREP
jgi:phage anti-repressor protein